MAKHGSFACDTIGRFGTPSENGANASNTPPTDVEAQRTREKYNLLYQRVCEKAEIDVCGSLASVVGC